MNCVRAGADRGHGRAFKWLGLVLVSNAQASQVPRLPKHPARARAPHGIPVSDTALARFTPLRPTPGTLPA